MSEDEPEPESPSPLVDTWPFLAAARAGNAGGAAELFSYARPFPFAFRAALCVVDASVGAEAYRSDTILNASFASSSSSKLAVESVTFQIRTLMPLDRTEEVEGAAFEFGPPELAAAELVVVLCGEEDL